MTASNDIQRACRAGGLALASALWWCGAAGASPTANDFGNTGLLQTPTARFNGAGTLRVGYASTRPYDVTYISAQPYDWLEATFRYTKFRYDDMSFANNGYLDKSFDIKLGLVSEGLWRPAISLGLQDFGGTGLLASEFLVASKRVGPMDFSAGLGWGRLGSRGDFANVVAEIDSGFEDRERLNTGTGGKFEVKRLFSGKRMSGFGGVAWAPPDSRWSIKLEYEGNDYSAEPFGNNLSPSSGFNAGVNYQARAYGLQLGWERGEQLSFSVYLTNDLSREAVDKVLDPPPTPVAPPLSSNTREPDAGYEPGSADLDAATVADIRQALARQNIRLIRLEQQMLGWQLTAWVSQSRYRSRSEVTRRVARTLAALAPEAVASLRVIQVRSGLELSRSTVNRQLVRAAGDGKAPEAIVVQGAVMTPPALQPVLDDPALPESIWDVDWFMGPRYRQSLGDPDESYRAQLFWRFGASKRWNPYWSSSALIEVGLLGDLDRIERDSDSTLPRVRSDIAEYYREGEHGLRRLEANYIRPLSHSTYVRFSAGIFEEMYGGVAGEFLVRPHDQLWAVGLNVNWVQQREFRQRFGFRDYEISTGHATIYRYFPRFSMRSEVSVGCYLAGDCGGTVQLAREFSTGARMGIFFTKTDVSSEEFGEGSFDKGFFLSMPFDLFLPRSSRMTAHFSFRPLTRDGGQKVRDGQRLYEYTQDRAYWR